MPASPAVIKSIAAIRKLIANPPATGRDLGLHLAIYQLLRKSKKIAENLESLRAVLAFAPEIEAYRGKGSQSAAVEFSRTLICVLNRIKERLPQSKSAPDLFPQESGVPAIPPDALAALDMLAEHAFQRVQDPPARRFLITVLQAQIDLGLNDGFGAMCITEDWDDFHPNP